MQMSYAQRLEDYHLDLVFAGQEQGFYIDVGAGHPVADNVSFWFYLKGWRGLVVEPQAALAGLYTHVRPRDAAVCALAGRHDGEADFHIVDRLHGFSTTLEDHAQAAAAFGTTYRTIRLPMRSLRSLAKEHNISSVDFLKIDVEGAEADVLDGLNLQELRPRVLVIEAIGPGDRRAWEHWEPPLLAKGYRFAFFDELNRFYVAEEASELVSQFPRESAPWHAVGHLYECGRALENAAHPDHALASRLTAGFLAALPRLEPELIRALLAHGPTASEALLYGTGEYPGPAPRREDASDRDVCRALMDTDRFRAALGRIAAGYDGGQLFD